MVFMVSFNIRTLHGGQLCHVLVEAILLHLNDILLLLHCPWLTPKASMLYLGGGCLYPLDFALRWCIWQSFGQRLKVRNKLLGRSSPLLDLGLGLLNAGDESRVFDDPFVFF